MTEKEMRQQRKEAQTKKKQQKKIVTLATILLIALLIGILGFLTVRSRNGTDEKNLNQGQNGMEQAGQDSPDTEKPKETETPPDETEKEDVQQNKERIRLDEAQKYTGNLILVNAEYGYHFDDNEADLMLTDVSSYGDSSIPVGEDGLMLAGRIMEPLAQMIRDCNQALNCSDTGVTSAWRSLEEQQQTYDGYEQEYGTDYADAYVAIPGYSEHHTGLALDMGIYYPGGGVGSFSKSDNAVWMNDNCYHYGFIRRYQEDKVAITGINNESWHFRYVGIPHATYMYQQNLCLEEYIDYLRNETSAENPMTVVCDAGTYRIYDTTENSIAAPEGEYTIDGDNIDGYIVTEKIAE